MPAMPFGDAEKTCTRSEISDTEELVPRCEQEAQDRAMELERNKLLNELELLHTEVANAIEYLSSPTDTWYRDMADRVRGWVPDRRAIGIVDSAIAGDNPLNSINLLQSDKS